MHEILLLLVGILELPFAFSARMWLSERQMLLPRSGLIARLLTDSARRIVQSDSEERRSTSEEAAVEKDVAIECEIAVLSSRKSSLSGT